MHGCLGISEGGNCTVRKYSRAAAIRRIRARRQSNFGEGEIVGQLSDSDIMCATGLVCRREVGNRGTCAQEMNGQFVVSGMNSVHSEACNFSQFLVTVSWQAPVLQLGMVAKKWNVMKMATLNLSSVQCNQSN